MGDDEVDRSTDADGQGDSTATDAALARRAQILATEHWGLLAARSTTQNEVLARISIFLALLSAGLVTIGLLGQASAFRDWFAPASLAILAFLSVIGVITQIRVCNAAEDDLMFVVAMNRLRGAYIDLDAGVDRYFLEPTADDILGMKRTYMFLRARSDASQILGSSAFLVMIVVASVVGLLAGAVVATSGGALAWSVAVGVVAGGAHIGVSMLVVGRSYRQIWSLHRPLRTTAGHPGAGAEETAP